MKLDLKSRLKKSITEQAKAPLFSRQKELDNQMMDLGLRLLQSGDKIVDLIMKGGVAYAGYVAMKHPMGAVFGLLGLSLAKSPNLVAGASGITMLSAIALTDWVGTLVRYGS